jgi:dCMP deaminase
MKPKFQQLYMDWAKRVAELSHARRLKVGAVIVKDDSVISYGYNGMPAGWDNNCEMHPKVVDPNTYKIVEKKDILVTRPEVLHAESNAIAKLAKSNNSGLGADLFVTHSPCIECAKLIFQSGIGRVFYGENYRDDAGIKFLKDSNVSVIKIDDDAKSV